MAGMIRNKGSNPTVSPQRSKFDPGRANAQTNVSVGADRQMLFPLSDLSGENIDMESTKRQIAQALWMFVATLKVFRQWATRSVQ
ncbi:hypothetical protein FXN63_19580 [Pigmentiphaga aceris]|uniref:Uncharacterized protein n=1 Tax=Pigmentiphaga aceris TaxID=1940612 RepID=A0A5C0B4L6_9BURK|nr:hypothetical protein [Pigmentiphaga aceris]QEI07791.1 hypothetical protein FXN63_19580 [Pigmentiphaga aceris]